MCTKALKKWALMLTFWLALHFSRVHADTLSGDSSVTGKLDVEGTDLSVGINAANSDWGVDFLYTDGTSAYLDFIANRSANTWRWQQNGGGTFKIQMSLDSTNTLSLFDSASTPAAQIIFNPTGTSTFSHSLTVNGTDNEMPNQTLVNAHSILTEGLGDARYLLPTVSTLALMTGSVATGTDAVAIGNSASATGSNSISIGTSATTTKSYGIAIGYNATANGGLGNEVAIGNAATASGNWSVALGHSAQASGSSAIAILGTASGGGALALGGTASGDGSISIMGRATNPFSVGITGSAYGNGSIGIGSGAVASGDHTIAIGNNVSTVWGSNGAVALGYNANASGNNGAMATGYQVVASGNNGSISAGYHTIASGNNGSVALGDYATASGDGSVALGQTITASGPNSMAVGIASSATGDYSIALGQNLTAASAHDTVIGLYNVGGGDPSAWNPADPLFEVGNGSSTTSGYFKPVTYSGYYSLTYPTGNWVYTIDGVPFIIDVTQSGSGYYVSTESGYYAYGNPQVNSDALVVYKNGNAAVQGTLTTGSDVAVTGGVTASGNVNASGNMITSGNVNASGNVTAANVTAATMTVTTPSSDIPMYTGN